MKSQKVNTPQPETNPSLEAQILNLQLPASATPGSGAPVQNLPLPQPLATAPPAAPPAPPPCHPRRRSKLMQLDKERFDLVNADMEEGMPYKEIISACGLARYGITVHTLSRWRLSGGHAEWLEQDAQQAEFKQRFQSLLDLVQQQDGNKLHEATFHLAAAQLCKILADFDPTVLRQKLQDDPKAFAQFLSALPKLSQADIDCEDHRVQMDSHWRYEEKRQARERAKIQILMEAERRQQALAAEQQLAAARQAQAQQAQPQNPPAPTPAAQPPPPNPQPT